LRYDQDGRMDNGLTLATVAYLAFEVGQQQASKSIKIHVNGRLYRAYK